MHVIEVPVPLHRDKEWTKTLLGKHMVVAQTSTCCLMSSHLMFNNPIATACRCLMSRYHRLWSWSSMSLHMDMAMLCSKIKAGLVLFSSYVDFLWSQAASPHHHLSFRKLCHYHGSVTMLPTQHKELAFRKHDFQGTVTKFPNNFVNAVSSGFGCTFCLTTKPSWLPTL